MNAEEASDLARQYVARMMKLMPPSMTAVERMDMDAYIHAAFMQGWAEERNSRLRAARDFVAILERSCTTTQ